MIADFMREGYPGLARDEFHDVIRFEGGLVVLWFPVRSGDADVLRRVVAHFSVEFVDESLERVPRVKNVVYEEEMSIFVCMLDDVM